MNIFLLNFKRGFNIVALWLQSCSCHLTSGISRSIKSVKATSGPNAGDSFRVFRFAIARGLLTESYMALTEHLFPSPSRRFVRSNLESCFLPPHLHSRGVAHDTMGKRPSSNGQKKRQKHKKSKKQRKRELPSGDASPPGAAATPSKNPRGANLPVYWCRRSKENIATL